MKRDFVNDQGSRNWLMGTFKMAAPRVVICQPCTIAYLAVLLNTPPAERSKINYPRGVLARHFNRHIAEVHPGWSLTSPPKPVSLDQISLVERLRKAVRLLFKGSTNDTN